MAYIFQSYAVKSRFLALFFCLLAGGGSVKIEFKLMKGSNMIVKHDFDEAVFHATKGIMQDRFPVLAEKYIRNAALYVQQAGEAVQAGDCEKIVQSVHALKSSSAMLGFIGFQRCAADIENKARKGELDLREDMARLKTLLRHTQDVLEPYVVRR